MLGKHKYKSILNAGWPYDPSPASCVYIYDYQSNGDPSDRAYTRIFSPTDPLAFERVLIDNWREHVPSEVDAPPDYFRHPYPAPTWTQRPSYLASLTLALPNFLPRSPKHSPEPSSEGPSHSRRGEVKPEPSHSFRRCRVHCSPNTCGSCKGAIDNADNAAPESSSSSRVKVENMNPTDPSIAPGEPGKGHLLNTYQSRLKVVAYEPTQALRDQIALLNDSCFEGACPLCCQMGVLCDIVSQRVYMSSKNQSLESNTSPATQIKPTTLRKLVSEVNLNGKLIFPTPLTSWTQAAPLLRAKQEPQDVQDVTSVAGPSQALWDEWARYQSNVRKPDDPGMR